MNYRTIAWPIATVFLVSVAPCGASLTLVGNSSLPHAGNLVTNGSFELGSPGPGIPNQRFWATGTSLTPFLVPPGWTSSGQPQSYALWGSDDTGPSFELRASDTLPDGKLGMYFGNGSQVTLNVPPTFNLDGTVTFSGAPTFTVPFGGPVTLSQTVNTHLSSAPSYSLSFWVSGEDAGGGGSGLSEGIFGFRMTNVLAGDPLQYLTVPDGAGAQGASRFYRYDFVPLNSTLPVTIEFTNWGHLDLSNFSATSFTTELVLDDVIIRPVPEPAVGLATLGLACLCFLRRRLPAATLIASPASVA